MAYSIEAAVGSGLFDEVMVSTDDEEIAEVAREYGATVPFLRSLRNADDYATTLMVIQEVLATYTTPFEEVCCLYATAPLVTPGLLGKSFEQFRSGGFDSLFPVVAYGFPIQRAMRRQAASGRVSMLHPAHLNSRSQDLEPTYHDAGMFYWLRPTAVLPTGRLWTENSGSIVIQEVAAQDIDTLVDWQLAEAKYTLRHAGR